jgi:hypothetical protein
MPLPMTAEDEDPKRSKPDGDDGGDDEDGGRTSPFGWVSLVIIAALVLGTWFLIQSLSASSNMQDCIQSGRRNCAPIDNTPP